MSTHPTVSTHPAVSTHVSAAETFAKLRPHHLHLLHLLRVQNLAQCRAVFFVQSFHCLRAFAPNLFDLLPMFFVQILELFLLLLRQIQPLHHPPHPMP